MTRLVHGFYAQVRQDSLLGPIFDTHIQQWDRHLAIMVDFGSGALRGTARFRGAPMSRHAALPGLNVDLFQRWRALFRPTTIALQLALGGWLDSTRGKGGGIRLASPPLPGRRPGKVRW